jgi:hypothetical protein
MKAGLSVNKDTGDLVLRTSYNPKVLELIKDTVPHYARGWDWQARVWRIAQEYGNALYAALTKAGVTVKDMRSVTSQPTIIREVARLNLTVEKSYIALAARL